MLGKVIAAAALACALTPANAELLTHKDLSLAVAKTIAETAIADCKARGYAVSVVAPHRNECVPGAINDDDRHRIAPGLAVRDRRLGDGFGDGER